MLFAAFISLKSQAQYISFNGFKMLHKASSSKAKINDYFVSNNWILRAAEDRKNGNMGYVSFDKGPIAVGSGITISFDKDEIREGFRGNIIHYYTYNKSLFDKIKNEVKMSDWKSTEPIIKDGKFLACYTDGYDVILLGPVTNITKDGSTVYTIIMVPWLDYHAHDEYLGRGLGNVGKD